MFKHVMDRELGIDNSQRDLEKHMSYKFLEKEKEYMKKFDRHELILEIEFPQENTVLYARTNIEETEFVLQDWVDSLEPYAVLMKRPKSLISEYKSLIKTLKFTAKKNVTTQYIINNWLNTEDEEWDGEIYSERMY
jgi:hypothetical protein